MQKRITLLFVNSLAILLFLGSRFLFREFNDSGSFWKSAIVWQEVFRYGLLALFYYLHIYVIIPKFYFNRKVWYYVPCILCSFLIITSLPNMIFNNEIPLLINNQNVNSFIEIVRHFFLNTQESLFIFVSILFLSLVFAISERLKQLRAEKVESEIAFLKAQVNPHFLFNSLNSIYSLSLTKNDKAPDAVLKLSNMMRYVTDFSMNETVPLEKELNYLNNYIELQKLRLPKSTILDYNITLETIDRKISPLILIHFVENAFKHGLSAEEESVIRIEIISNEKELSLYTSNAKLPNPTYSQQDGGVGLQNTINKLQFLYPNKHKLIINDTKRFYFVTLKMQLEK